MHHRFYPWLEERQLAKQEEVTFIPVILETAALLTAFACPNHIVHLCSWGLAYLPPNCISNAFGYSARDGQKIAGILVHPLKTTTLPAPLLIFVHGGPESHVSNGWLSRYSQPVHYAAALGYLSFLPNYRGSTGRGVAFSQLGLADYAGTEFNDLLDAKRYLVQRGLALTDQTGIMGSSYGGYAAAWAATAMSENFAANVMSMGISNQISKFGTTDIPSEMYYLHAGL